MKKMTPKKLLEKKKNKEPIVAVTAYDFPMAKCIDSVGIDLILVGDSLGMVVLGYDSTLPVTMEEMLHHTRAVSRGVKNSLVVADMPFMSYQTNVKDPEAVRNAGRFIKEAGAHAVKIEGGEEMAPLIKKMTDLGIPVLAHIGLQPQQVLKEGGYSVKGKTPSQAQQLIKDAQALEKSGAFGIVLEALPAKLAKEISAAVSIPTIGIGAGPNCDGQILVINDLLGLNGTHTPKFVKAYAKLNTEIEKALNNYKKDVQQGRFPDETTSY